MLYAIIKPQLDIIQVELSHLRHFLWKLGLKCQLINVFSFSERHSAEISDLFAFGINLMLKILMP